MELVTPIIGRIFNTKIDITDGSLFTLDTLNQKLKPMLMLNGQTVKIQIHMIKQITITQPITTFLLVKIHISQDSMVN